MTWANLRSGVNSETAPQAARTHFTSCGRDAPFTWLKLKMSESPVSLLASASSWLKALGLEAKKIFNTSISLIHISSRIEYDVVGG